MALSRIYRGLDLCALGQYNFNGNHQILKVRISLFFPNEAFAQNAPISYEGVLSAGLVLRELEGAQPYSAQ